MNKKNKKSLMIILSVLSVFVLTLGLSSIVYAGPMKNNKIIYHESKIGYTLPGNPSRVQLKECCLNNGRVYCGNGWCYCHIGLIKTEK